MIALSPEWDHWFDEAFADLVAGDDDLVRFEFAAMIDTSWRLPPAAHPVRTTDDPKGEQPRPN